MLRTTTIQVPHVLIFHQGSLQEIRSSSKVWSLTNLGPLALSGSLEALESLGIHFITPLGTIFFIILQNLTE